MQNVPYKISKMKWNGWNFIHKTVFSYALNAHDEMRLERSSVQCNSVHTSLDHMSTTTSCNSFLIGWEIVGKTNKFPKYLLNDILKHISQIKNWADTESFIHEKMMEKKRKTTSAVDVSRGRDKVKRK